MNPTDNWLRAGVALAVVLLTGLNGLTAHPHPVPSAESKAESCLAPEYRQFDFWIGDWDVFDVDDPATAVATIRVDRILDGCVLREDYQGSDGLKGVSLSIYDASRRVWQQSWVTNHGRLLVIEGNLRADKMILAGAYTSASGEETLVRGIWKPVNGDVSEKAVTSTDGGKTWKPWFDLVFRPQARPSDGDGGKIVAGLDTQYQAAVQRNDAATMARILADDFLLVTGSGKTYTRADLLDEARSGRVRYEHQEDTGATIHLWGDTAVVTAKLWEKGTDKGEPFDYTLWFSDTYMRTPSGWRYVFGQASLPLPSRKK
jgi:ketosteroid isomerase-like protein